jgi:hypothetical protein
MRKDLMRKLNELKVKKKNQIKITKRFALFQNLNVDKDINRAWENVKENIKTSAKKSLGLHELKQHKPWFDKECLGFLDQRKQAKMQWIQDPSRSNVDNPNNVRRDASRHFRNKEKAYLKAKIEELETNSTINNVRDLYGGINQEGVPAWNYYRKGRERRFGCRIPQYYDEVEELLNVHGVNDVRQAEIHTAEPLMPKPSAFEVELAIEKLKSHKSQGVEQIPAELIKAGGRIIHCAIPKLIIYIWNKEELPEEWKELIIVPIHKKGDNTDCNNYRGISLLPNTYTILSNILLSRLIPYAE